MAIDPVATCRYLAVSVGSSGRICSPGSSGLEDEDEDEDEDDQSGPGTAPLAYSFAFDNYGTNGTQETKGT